MKNVEKSKLVIYLFKLVEKKRWATCIIRGGHLNMIRSEFDLDLKANSIG